MSKPKDKPLTPFERVDPDRLDAAVLAILCYNDATAGGAWKGLPWDALDRLHAKGLISEPAKQRKSVDLDPAGLVQGEAAFELLFARKPCCSHASRRKSRRSLDALARAMGNSSPCASR